VTDNNDEREDRNMQTPWRLATLGTALVLVTGGRTHDGARGSVLGFGRCASDTA